MNQNAHSHSFTFIVCLSSCDLVYIFPQEPVERIVEKVVTVEVPVEKIVTKEVPVDRVVEKLVHHPVCT